MATLSSVRNTLLDELARTGQLTAQAHTYINNAIRHYRKKTYWFTEKTDTLSTTASGEYIDLSSDFAKEYGVNITINGTNRYVLQPRTMQEMDEMYVSAENYTGYPQDYTIYNYRLRLGPVPDSGYPITIHYRREAPELTGETSSNYLLDNAQELIIARAGKLMASLVLQDVNRSLVFNEIEKEENQRLRSETTAYQITGRPPRRK